jgi:hypothetical protein
MKSSDNRNDRGRQIDFASELTCVPPVWNHPKTIALCFACREVFLKRPTAQRNFLGRFPVKQG